MSEIEVKEENVKNEVDIDEIIEKGKQGKLSENDLDDYSAETVEAMQKECAERRKTMQRLYEIQAKVNL